MSLVVRVIAPTGRDTAMIIELLQRHSIAAEACSRESFLSFSVENEPAGPLLIAEEALSPDFIEQLSHVIHTQPAWSDLPLLILTGSGRETSQSHRLQSERVPLGSPVLLERPIRTATLISSVQAAVRARAKQYETRDAVAALRHEQETLQVVLDNLPVGVVLAKANGELVLGNLQMEKLLRHPLLPTTNLEAHAQWPAFHPDGRRLEAEEYPLARSMKLGHAIPPEDYLYDRGDGSRAWIRFAAAPILGSNGEVTGGVVALSDVDHQKRAELALIQSEKLAAVGRLAASISHEINNPLEAVTNLLYLASQHQGLPDAIRTYLDLADQELRRVSQIVSHTLRFYRQSTHPRAITPEELLEPTLGLFGGRLSNSDIELLLQHRGATAITCYEGEIRQVLNNLIGNAIDSMRSGGRLIVRTRNARRWKIGVAGVRVTIADNGHGMTRQVLERAFDAFYTTKGINGTGLGLWISQGIIENHHGLLQVRSSCRPERSGTVFSLFLPAKLF